ncbi:hypothetical protein HaLaN_33085, partial [Haematococcus lacustris]
MFTQQLGGLLRSSRQPLGCLAALPLYGFGTFCNALQSKVYKRRCTWEIKIMQVLNIVLKRHGKLRLLPDGSRGSAFKDEMHGVWCHVIDANAVPMLEPCSIRASLPMH